MNFKENLKIYREQKGYTGKEFAELLEIPYQKYMNYENKGSEAKYELLIRMADILGVTTDELLGHAFTPEESKQKKVLYLFKKAGFECELNESTILLCYKGLLTFELPKDEFFKKAFEMLSEGEQLSENYVLEKIKFFFSSGKTLNMFFNKDLY